MQIPLKYGHTTLVLDLDDTTSHIEVLTTGRACPECDEATFIQNALAQPIKSPPLRAIVAPGQRVAVVTSDVTRPCPSALLLPFVLDELKHGGVRDQDILVVFALGTHRPHTQAEQIALVGERVFRRVQCVDFDPSDCKSIGHSSRGTPISIFRPVLEADVRVCLGNIEYHYFLDSTRRAWPSCPKAGRSCHVCKIVLLRFQWRAHDQ